MQQSGRDLFLIFLRLGRDYRLPVFVARNWFAQCPYLGLSLTDDDVVIDYTVTIDTRVEPKAWPEFYRNAIEDMPPGVTAFIIHRGFGTNRNSKHSLRIDRLSVPRGASVISTSSRASNSVICCKMQHQTHQLA